MKKQPNSLPFMLFLVLLLTCSLAHANTLIVLDASGSMWGQIEGKAKIQLAKNVLSELLSRWPADEEVGLMVYGHRAKGDCNDIEVLIPVGSIDQAKFKAAISSISPKGMTPMTEAVRRAAETLRSSEKAATVILISDGEETCDQNPCAVAAELEKSGVAFTAHVVGFDLESAGDKARSQMNCIADSTGGKFLEAHSASELLTALSEVAALPPATPEPTPTETPTPSPTPTPVPVKAAKNLLAQLVLLEGGEPLSDGSVSWSLKTPEKPNKQVAFSHAAVFETSVPAGTYLLTAKRGEVSVEQEITLTDERQEVTLNLNAGYLSAKVFVSEGGEQLSNDLRWRVFRAGTTKQAAFSYNKEPQWLIPAGEYEVQVSWGNSNALIKGTVSVLPGESESLSLTLGAGILKLKAFASEGGEQLDKDLKFRVLSEATSLDGKREQVAYSYEAAPAFEIAAGKYRAEVTWGNATGIQEIVEVKAGEASEYAINLNAGVLALSTSEDQPTDKMHWEIYSSKTRLDGSRDKIAVKSYARTAQFFLPAGKYLVRLRIGDSAQEKEIEVTAGSRTEDSVIPASEAPH
ncbi:MAG: VWA domain-containing protein [Bdellovibrionales bacterium]|nr:VWA domain-containing protein [Bdellovibrionales bacterium]